MFDVVRLREDNLFVVLHDLRRLSTSQRITMVAVERVFEQQQHLCLVSDFVVQQLEDEHHDAARASR